MPNVRYFLNMRLKPLTIINFQMISTRLMKGKQNEMKGSILYSAGLFELRESADWCTAGPLRFTRRPMGVPLGPFEAAWHTSRAA